MIYKYKGESPEIHESCFIAPSADIIGSVSIGESSSVWFGAVIRGDGNYIKIGKGSNIQDNSTLHINSSGSPTIIGDNVTVGHGVILHGCQIEDNCLIGMGATILDGAIIGENTLIAAGSIVTGGKKIPSGVLCLGVPAKVVHKLTEEEIQEIREASKHYIMLSEDYK
jgi:carbonic anhydrase/acetyltransferase-like protein (isoleucine patch superfamily)